MTVWLVSISVFCSKSQTFLYLPRIRITKSDDLTIFLKMFNPCAAISSTLPDYIKILHSKNIVSQYQLYCFIGSLLSEICGYFWFMGIWNANIQILILSQCIFYYVSVISFQGDRPRKWDKTLTNHYISQCIFCYPSYHFNLRR